MALTRAKLIADGVIDVDNLAAGHSITTSNIGEGSNLYYTDGRVASYLTTNSYATEGYVTTAISGLTDGSGTTNFISKWSDANTLTDSIIFDNGTNVGIGTNNPASKLEIFGYGNGLSFRGATSDYSSLNLFIEDGVAAKIQSTEVGAGTVLPVAVLMKGVETARFQPTGGISFNGDTAAANALDDYEEGTFTPAYVGSLGGEIAGYADQGGNYVKIGRLVIVTISLLAQRGTISGNISISGLPFANTGLNWVNMTARRRWATDFQLAGQLNSSATVELYKIKPNETNPLPITRDDMSSATNTFVNTITTTFSYITA